MSFAICIMTLYLTKYQNQRTSTASSPAILKHKLCTEDTTDVSLDDNNVYDINYNRRLGKKSISLSGKTFDIEIIDEDDDGSFVVDGRKRQGSHHARKRSVLQDFGLVTTEEELNELHELQVQFSTPNALNVGRISGVFEQMRSSGSTSMSLSGESIIEVVELETEEEN